MKSVRFSLVVEQCGQPTAHALWIPPDKDPTFQAALKAERVMSIGSERGKADSGTVGYHPAGKASQLLIFPKSLKRFAGNRVVGVKFDQIAQPEMKPAEQSDVLKGTARSASKRVEPRKPAGDPSLRTAANTDKPPEEENGGIPPHRLRAAPPRRERSQREPRNAIRDTAPDREPPTRAPKAPTPTASSGSIPSAAELVREIRAALAELQDGKTVAAYQRLERALK